jgi:hypothetical protein
MTQGGTLLIHMHQDIVITKTAYHLFSGEAGHLLGGAIPIQDLPLAVGDIHPFRQVVQYRPIPIRLI